MRKIATLQNFSLALVLKEITVCLGEKQCNKVLNYVVSVIIGVDIQRRGKLTGIKMRNVSQKEKGRQTEL